MPKDRTMKFYPLSGFNRIAGKIPSFGGIKGKTIQKKVTVVLDEEAGHFDAFYGDDKLNPDDVIHFRRNIAIPLAESLYAAFKAEFWPYDQNDPDEFFEEEASHWNISEEWTMVLNDNSSEDEEAFEGITRRGKRIKARVYDSSMMPTKAQINKAKKKIENAEVL